MRTLPPVPRVGEFPGGLTYLAVGEGPPRVLLPGLAREAERRAQPYRGLARLTHREVYIVNRPCRLHRGITMAELAAAHAGALRAHFGTPVDLLGISTGGAIALQLAVDHPEVVCRLVVVASASWLGDKGRQKLREYGEHIAAGKTGARVLASVLTPAVQWLATAAIWLNARAERSVDPTNMLATIDAECGFDVTSRLGTIPAPTLLVAGGRDRAFPPKLTRATAAGIRNSQLVLYPRGACGHDAAPALWC
jgi:pimeloyl-ACP methyl ester carboxylesterase